MTGAREPTDGPPADQTLAGSASPFLRHGAEQPVDWMPWGVAAFRRARDQDRPILLDIGAVWCHWCHVMDRESYEDPEIAALINERFVPVKVDRDERPDVDSRYQRAIQILAGQGGWPLTAFLNPAGEAFYGGTYFPPRDAHGRPSFRRVLDEIHRIWREDRERVGEAAAAVAADLARIARSEASPGELDRALIRDAIGAISGVYDRRHGGFGRAPKFPNAGAIMLLLDDWLDPAEGAEGAGGERAREMAVRTLEAMADGGIYDQLGGGFHRYSTDERWLVPHFEKMAYDNGTLLEALARAASVVDSATLRRAAEGVVRYYREVAPELHQAGGFPASQDADIGPDDDGDYWTWTEAEVRDAVGEPDADLAIRAFGLRDHGGAMHLDPERHVLFRAEPAKSLATALAVPVEDVERRIAESERAMIEARRSRPRPFVDETLYAGWVALVASGHLAAARYLDMRDAGETALRALERVWAEAWREDQGLAHRLGDTASPLFHLSDQAHCAGAMVDAFEWTQDPLWLERARRVVDVMDRRFRDETGAYRDTPADGRAEVDVLAEGRVDITDSPEPSPNAVAALTLFRMAALAHEPGHAERGRDVLRAFAGTAPRFAPNAATWFRALRWATRPVTTVAVVEEESAGPLLRAALGTYRPETVVLRLEPGAVEGASLPEALSAMVTGDAPRAYVCAGRTCAAPVSDPAAVAELLRGFRG